MSRHVRIRCPICGLLTWQSRLDKDWEFQVLIQHTKGAGRGHGWKNTYYEPETEEGVFLIKIALADKLEEVASKLRGEARSEQDEAFSEALRDHDLDRAFGVSKSAREAGFEVIRGEVSGLTARGVEFLVASGRGRIALVEDRAEPAGSAYEYEEEQDYDQEPEDDHSEASDYVVETEDSQVRQPGLSGFRFFNLGGRTKQGSGVKWKDDDDEETVSGSSRTK